MGPLSLTVMAFRPAPSCDERGGEGTWNSAEAVPFPGELQDQQWRSATLCSREEGVS